jgi:hypothetical protein
MTTNPDNAKPPTGANATMLTDPGYAKTPAEAMETPKEETQENTKTPADEAMESPKEEQQDDTKARAQGWETPKEETKDGTKTPADEATKFSILLLKIDYFRCENEELREENQDLCGKNEDLSDKLMHQSQLTIRVLGIISLRDENEDLREKNEGLRDKLKVQEDLMPQATMLRCSMQLGRRVFVFGYKGSKEEITQVLNNAALTTTSTNLNLTLATTTIFAERTKVSVPS